MWRAKGSHWLDATPLLCHWSFSFCGTWRVGTFRTPPPLPHLITSLFSLSTQVLACCNPPPPSSPPTQKIGVFVLPWRSEGGSGMQIAGWMTGAGADATPTGHLGGGGRGNRRLLSLEKFWPALSWVHRNRRLGTIIFLSLLYHFSSVPACLARVMMLITVFHHSLPPFRYLPPPLAFSERKREMKLAHIRRSS